jgi:predicted deacylase
LLAGIHGAEYASIAAARRFMQSLDERQLAGTVVAAPIVNVTSFWARSPFVVPEDGKNLNRCFPGDASGTFAEALADAVFRNLIAPSDYLVDLHGGDLVEALQPFALHDESPQEDRARAMATAFGLPYVVRQARSDSPIAGTTSAAAADVGIPAIIAEAGGCGLLEEDAVAMLARGVENVLRLLGLLPGEPEPPPQPMRSVGRFLWLRSQEAGWWEPSVRVGEELEAGARLGTVTDLYGGVLEEIVAPEAGVLLFVTTSPAVGANGLLLGLGADLTPM